MTMVSWYINDRMCLINIKQFAKLEDIFQVQEVQQTANQQSDLKPQVFSVATPTIWNEQSTYNLIVSAMH